MALYSLVQLTFMLLTQYLVIVLSSPVKFVFDVEPPSREEKSLLNTFPFNQQETDHTTTRTNRDQTHGRQEKNVPQPFRNLLTRLRYPKPETVARDTKQEESSSFSFSSLANSPSQKGAKRCIDKVEMIEETQYEDVVKCDHSYDRRCHTTYVTNYLSQQVEECDENFLKSCYIEYDTVAFNETVEVCRNPLVKDCNLEGEEICRTEYESECWTKQEVHVVEDDVVRCQTEIEEKCEDETSGYTTNTKCSKWPKEVCSVSKKNVKKFTPITACKKEPRQLCAPAGCGFRKGAKECRDVVKTVVQEKPREECNLEPKKTCKFVTKLVPKLEPKQECVDVPKEVCATQRQNPRTITKPLIKKWCYTPTE